MFVMRRVGSKAASDAQDLHWICDAILGKAWKKPLCSPACTTARPTQMLCHVSATEASGMMLCCVDWHMILLYTDCDIVPHLHK